MSQTVDSRVLEMRFDNKQFEAGVATSMSTLDKLKQKLNLTQSSKNLNEIGKVSKNLDFSSAINSVSALEKRFSALGIAGMTVIQNLTTSAMHLGSKLTSWFTGGVVQGGITRAMNLEKARFQLQGLLKDTEKVDAVMENVNASVDGTAYSLDQAAVVASMFAATGMKAGEKMEGALRAVAGTAAMTSADYQRVGLIFTQISGQGRVMGNDLLQLSNLGINAAATLAKHFGKSEAEIREMVSKGQVSFEMFAEAMDDAFGAHAAKANATFTGAMANVKAALARIGAEFISPLVVENGPLVKFFNTLRERINEVKESIGPLASTFTDFVSKVANGATKILGKMDFSKPFKKFEGLNIGFEKLSKAINKIVAPVDKVKEHLNTVTDTTDKVKTSLEKLDVVVDDVLLGKFGNGKERIDKLTKSGYNWCEVQNKVNEKLGNTKRYTKEQIAAQDKLINSQEKSTAATEKTETKTKELTKAQKEQLKSLVKMSDEQLRSKGYTEEQIKALKSLKNEAKKIGMPIDEFIDKLDKINGKFLLIRSFGNIAKAIGTVFKSLSSAFRDVFEPIKPQKIFDIIAGFHKLTAALVPSAETADKLTRTFKGLFAILDLVSTVFGGAFKIVFKIVSSILEGLGVGILDITATVGDMIYKFNEWFQDNIFAKFIDKIIEKIPVVIDGIKEFIDSLHISESAASAFKNVSEGLGAAFDIINGSISKSLNTGLKILSSVLEIFGTNLGEIASKIGKCIIKFRDWISENTIFLDSVNKIATIIATLIKAIGNLAKQFLALKPVQDFFKKLKETITDFFSRIDFSFDGGFLDSALTSIQKAVSKISNWLKTLENSEHFGRDLVLGLVNGIKSGVGTIIGAVAELAKNILTTICSILGIHSPSTEARKIGENVIEGLALGLRNGASKLLDLMKSIGQKILDALKNINWSDIIVVGSIAAFFFMLNKILNIAEKLIKPLEGLTNIFNSFAGVLKSASKWIDSKTLETKSKAILNFALAIGVLAASIYVLSKIDLPSLAKAVVALGLLAGIIIGLTYAVSRFDKVGDVSFIKLSVMILSLGVTLILMSKALKIIADMNPEQSQRAVLQLTALILGLVLMVAAFGKLVKADASGNMGKAGSMLLKMAVAIGILVLVMKLVAGMSWSDIGKGAAVVAGAILLLGSFSLLGSIPNGNVSKAGTMLLKMSIAIGILVMVIKLIAGIPAGDIAKGLLVIAAMEILFGALMVLSKFAGKNATKAGAMFLMMSLAIGVLALTIKSIAGIPDGDITKSMKVITNIMLLFMGVMLLSNFVGKNATKAGAMFIMMSSAIGMLAMTIKIIAGIPQSDIDKALGVIAAIEFLFMAVMLLSEFVGNNADKAGTMFLKMSLAILVLVGAIALLSILDPADVIRGTLCVSLFLGMFALIMKASENITSSYKTLLMMAICIGLLAASIVALSFLDQNKVVTAAACMSAVLGMFALVEKASSNVTTAMGTLVVLTLAIGMISGCLYLLAQLPIEQSIGAAVSLSIVLLSISAALIILSKVNAVSPMAIVALGAMVVVVGLLGVVLGLMQKFDIQPSITTAKALSILLLAMSAALVILAVVGTFAAPALIGVGVLMAAIIAIGGVMVAIGALMEHVPTLETFLDKGITVLGKIGEGLGQFIGKFAGGLMEGVTSALPEFGSNLGQFMTNAKPFFDGLNDVDPSVTESAKSLAAAILTITGANILESLTSWLTGGTDMSKFGEQLVGLGKGMKAYASEVAGIDTGAITASAEAAKGLAQVAKAIPKEGGFLQDLAGTQDISSFGSKLGAFGKGMKAYASEVAGIDTGAITASAEAAKGLTQVAKALPKEGGFWQSIVGAQDISSFGSKLKAFGQGMKSYAMQVAGIDTGAITASVEAAKGLTKVAKAVPRDGGFWQSLAGKKDIGSFGSKLEAFGKGMKSYGAQVSGINAEAISSSVSAAKKLVSLTKTMKDTDTSGVKTFVSAVKKLSGTDIKGVVNAFNGASKAANLVSAGVKMVKSVGTGMKSAGSSLKTAAKNIASSTAKQFSSHTSAFHAAGVKLCNAIKTGFAKSKNSLSSAAKTMVVSAAKVVRDKQSSFESAGKALCQGLRNGINNNKSLAINAAKRMANSVESTVRNALEINSPSKVFIEIGKGIPEGFAKGIDKFGYYVNDSVSTLANRAIKGTSRTIAKIGALMDSDIDIQPTIAPVVDLSAVESGIGIIDGMFNRNFGLSANANINAINTAMSRRNQNGVNDEVISAIDRLRKDLGNIGGDSYTINGVTYDDGSNVSDAVKTLVRAAKVERRV